MSLAETRKAGSDEQYQSVHFPLKRMTTAPDHLSGMGVRPLGAYLFS